MKIQAIPVEFKEVEAMRELYRQEQNCQIIHDSALSRKLADAYLILVEGKIAGYGGVWNRYEVGRAMEFYLFPPYKRGASPIFREFLQASSATPMEAQTNCPLLLMLLFEFAKNIAAENILFQDSKVTNLVCPNGVFRQSTNDEKSTIFEHHSEPVGDWIVESAGKIVASGGFLCHYNPPYGDIYMEVQEESRRQGIGSYLVQELKTACYEAGKKPSARCNSDNVASRKTLMRAGFEPCARLLTGEIA